ncbi:hypothetical protein B0T39_22290 [Chromobacterium haemolyticum]|nr:hypothetical protein B0T39_22290 [Chromobacterium haemolyticum]
MQKSKGIKFNIQDVSDITITTYIPLFEQLLDLIVQNATKYSPRSGTVEISCSRIESEVCIEISSIGPFLEASELEKIGQKEFRGKNAIKSQNNGSGYGVYNALRIAKILNGSVNFAPSSKPITNMGGVDMGHFSARIKLPLILNN